MSWCNLGKHSFIYGNFKIVKTSFGNEFYKDTIPTKRKCVSCGRIYIVTDWKHNWLGKIKVKWRRIK